MSDFKLNSITMQGAVVIASLVAGGKLEFTRIQVGDGNIPDGQTPMTMTGLAHPLFDVTIHEVDFDSEAQATIKGIFSNAQVETGFFYRELGLFAKDPTTGKEILFSYGNAADSAEWINAAGEGSIIEKEVHIVALVGNATEVTATLKSGIYETKENVEKMMALKADLDATAEEGGRVVPEQMRFDEVQTLYVDAAAAEGGDGSEAKPFKSIQAAVDAAYMGARVISIKVKAGTYAEAVSVQNAPGTLFHFTRNGAGVVSLNTLSAIFTQVYMSDMTIVGETDSGNGVTFANVGNFALQRVTVGGTKSTSGVAAYNSKGFLEIVTINGCGTAFEARDGSQVALRSVGGTGNAVGVAAFESVVTASGYTLTATTPFVKGNGGAINTDTAISTFPSNQTPRLSLGDFSAAAALKAAILTEFKKLGVGETRACWFANNVTGGFGIFGTGQRMFCDITKTTDSGAGYGLVVFYSHNEPAGFMHIQNGAWQTDTPVPFFTSEGGNVNGQIRVSGGQNFPAINHVSGGELWLFDKDDTTYKGGFILRAIGPQGNGGPTTDLEGKYGSTLKWGGKELVRSVNGFTANDTGAVTIPNATASQYGLVKLADETAVLSENVEAAVHVPMMYKINDFRRKRKAYAVGDRVACAFLYDLFLECTKAGTTSSKTLDTRTVKHGQVITDGTARWTVRTHVRSVAGAVAGADGNVVLPLDYLPLKGGTVSGNLAVTGNATVGGKNVVRSVNGVAASSAGDVTLPNFEQDGAKSVSSPDYNKLTEPGFYGCQASGATNGPGSPRKLLVMGLPGAKTFVTQVAFPIGEGVCPAIRFLDADGSWTSWGKIALVDSSEELQANRLTSKGGQFRTVMPNLTKGEAPSSTIYSHWSFFDGHGFDYVKNRMGAFQYRTSSDGSSFISMWVNANKANDVTAASLGICVKKDGTVYTYAPAPKDDCDSETEIATAHWARSFGGTTWGLGTVAPSVSSRFSPNDCNSINRTGFYTVSKTANSLTTSILMHIERAFTAGIQAAQTTYGTDGSTFIRTREGDVWSEWYELARRSTYDTFTSGEHYISNAKVTFGETPSAVQWTRVLFADKTKTKALGYTGHRYATDGQSRVVMLCYKPDGSGDSASIWVGYDAAGNIKTFAPTPVSSSNDDSIPTTRWSRAREEVVVDRVCGKTQPTMTALIDWNTMKSTNGGTDVRNINNTTTGIKAYGGDSGGTLDTGDIILKASYENYDALLIEYTNDGGVLHATNLIPMWQFKFEMNTKGLVSLLRDDQRWNIIGRKHPTSPSTTTRLEIWPNGQNCGIIEIYGVTY